eukprot:gnl/MRDRNA2_/MRDRNA2_110442_c0_seq1.p1 gnl/MRDRNA2_/MRDRNA2_110442_c0~~gnl/MRDRNA2_/MRDRNA2_110442_c0_seq1.p1  ORF type:complete len:227 (-),score=40.33 gnl/MRDRNA2_/MRDRNA2_110442_c0_seq1:225-854(-)
MVDTASNTSGPSSWSTQPSSDMSGRASFSRNSSFSPSLSQNAWSSDSEIKWNSDSEIEPVETTPREPSYNGSSTPDFPEDLVQETVKVMPPVQRMPVPVVRVQQPGALENDASSAIEHCPGPKDRYRNAPWRQKKRGVDVQISQAPLEALTENEPENEPTPGDRASQDSWCAGSFEVKNTFIDFSNKDTSYPLRNVGSAGGRLSELEKL